MCARSTVRSLQRATSRPTTAAYIASGARSISPGHAPATTYYAVAIFHRIPGPPSLRCKAVR